MEICKDEEKRKKQRKVETRIDKIAISQRGRESACPLDGTPLMEWEGQPDRPVGLPSECWPWPLYYPGEGRRPRKGRKYMCL